MGAIDTLKLPAIGLVLLAASQSSGVHGAAAPNEYVTRCGYGYQQCHDGYECVKNTKYQYGVDVSSCQTIGYSATRSITPSSPPYTGYHETSYDLSSSRSVYTSNDNPPEYDSFKESAFSTPTWYTPDYSATPTAMTYDDQPPKYHSPSEYGSAAVYTLPLPTTDSDYPSGCSYVCSGTPSNSGYQSSVPSYASRTKNIGVDPGLFTPNSGSPSSYQSGYYHHPVYQTDPVSPQKSVYSLYPGKPSNPIDSSHPRRSLPKFTAVVGAQTKVVERRSIDVLQKDHKEVFNMLILALESLQNRTETEDLSYYQLSGIHGYPFIPWQYPHQNPDPQTGYCTHKSAIFTTWHRPYVILLEQILQKTAVSIAKKFTGQNALKYQPAAEEVRMPYWDWASVDTNSRMPPVVLEEFIAVVKPGSQASVRIRNPFYNYKRKDIGRNTVRASTAEVDLVSSFNQRKLSTSDLFSVSSYNEFSKNLENIHDLVHVDVGGDMADISNAAFDPIFWLHHCNVDRLMAMYQASHPNTYLTPQSRSPTFALHLPGTDDLSTPLYPFRHPNAKEWTSNDVKTAASIFKYGYSYPEVPPGLSDDALRKFTSQKANDLYGPKVGSASFNGDKSGAPEATARREWTANVVVDSEELPGSQQVQIYIGSYDRNRNGASRDDLAGVAAIFSSSFPMEIPDRYLNISVPLTQALVDKNIGLRPEDVVPKLVKQLHWVIKQVGTSNSTSNDAIIPVTDLKSLKISISSNIADYPEDKTELPTKSGSQTYYAPTAQKAGGLQPGQAPPIKGPVTYNGTASA